MLLLLVLLLLLLLLLLLIEEVLLLLLLEEELLLNMRLHEVVGVVDRWLLLLLGEDKLGLGELRLLLLILE